MQVGGDEILLDDPALQDASDGVRPLPIFSPVGIPVAKPEIELCFGLLFHASLQIIPITGNRHPL